MGPAEARSLRGAVMPVIGANALDRPHEHRCAAGTAGRFVLALLGSPRHVICNACQPEGQGRHGCPTLVMTVALSHVCPEGRAILGIAPEAPRVAVRPSSGEPLESRLGGNEAIH